MTYFVEYSLFSQPNSLSPPLFFPKGGPHSTNSSHFSPSTMNPFPTKTPSSVSVASSTQSRSLHNSSKRFTSIAVLLIGAVSILTFGSELQNNIPLKNLFSTYRAIPLRPSIFRFPSLVVLKLKTLKVVGNISLVDLPLLKTLHLDRVYLKNKANFNKLLYGCPVLEDLIAQIYYIEPPPQPQEVFTLTTATAAGEFQILSNLIKVQINACDVPFRAIHNVQFLSLTMRDRLPDPDVNSYCTGSPIFRNLAYLQLCMHNFHHWDHVVEVLQHCPKLQILKLNKLAINNINWKYPNLVPECISSHLRSCTINYEGREDELRFTKYILQNARLLGVMKINISHLSNQKPNRRILKELYSCPRISRKCKISID